jgi:hypothetical protein
MTQRTSNEGAERLKAHAKSLAEIVGYLAGRGVTVTRMTVSNWRSSKFAPPDEARDIFAEPPFNIPKADWDRAVGASAAGTEGLGEKPGANLRPVLAVAPGGDAGVAPGANEEPPAEQSAAELAGDLLGRIRRLREAAEAEGTPAAKARILELEGKAVDRFARLTGQDVTELEIGRSPQWQRLKAEIFECLKGHPDAAKALAATMAEAS